MQDPNGFTVTWELVPGRGAWEKEQDAVFQAAEAAAKGRSIHALTITDNPGGNPALSPAYLGIEFKRLGIEPVVHLAPKDKSRTNVEAELFGLARSNVNNILVITGDYPGVSFKGRAKPVFDLDSIQTIQLIREMNEGRVETPKGPAQVKPTDFFVGAAVSPFKATEGEQLGQYFKLRKKLMAGAGFIVTQLGYDARKYHEVIQYMKLLGYDVPVIGSVYVLSYPVAKAMNANQVPGCVVTGELLKVVDEERKAPDKGRSARLLRAAKTYAMLKGMGYNGVHIGGHGLKYEEVVQIMSAGEELAPRWTEFVNELNYSPEGTFYVFKRDAATGLNTTELAPRDQVRARRTVHGFTFRLMHDLFFAPKAPFFGMMRWLSKTIDGTALDGPFTRVEHLIKLAMSNCQQCGDCALLDIAYMCPMSQCPKNQRNGPCGGSCNGYCEVYPEKKKCFYVRAYEMLKAYHEEDTLGETILPPVNWELHHTSSWTNYFLGRDHSAALLPQPKSRAKAPPPAAESPPARRTAAGDN
jgi:methylenetetrahydrofolate reductase (NADPH)